MANERAQRQLAAIAVADILGYSRLMELDEAGTLAAWKERQKAILEPVVGAHDGRIVKLMGDGALMEFASAVNAVTAAAELQRRMAQANAGLPDERRIVLRIGINLGDVIEEANDIYGEGVNLAARLEGLAEPGGLCISGKVYDEVRGKVDVAFADAGERQLKNLAAPVRTYRSAPDMPSVAAAPALTGVRRTSIAVLPLDDLSSDHNQQYLADGIAEDIITELSRFRNLQVAARHASFHLRGKGINPLQVAHDLGTEYVVEGSVRKTGDKIRVTVQLIDVRTGNHVWAERYDRQSYDIFAVQDEVVSAIVATLEGRMVSAAAEFARKKPTSNWTAYDFFLQGRELSNLGLEKEAVPLFERATAIDPNFAQAHAWLTMARLGTYWFDVDPASLALAAVTANRALALDSNDPTVQQANGMVLLWQREHERAGVHFDRAIALNPVELADPGRPGELVALRRPSR